ncbi:helix-turn-helix domain-containing protein [Poseidonocella sp. HB161398]|uniref:AraC family transcriptional regulator n=1 Tax=Poseidonocella sp. HB161398 TaxID=2320855 RepID=UPI0011082012|nr:helix-turn-helix transcriptional regulator [Poseidonocella sp. HB161398]
MPKPAAPHLRASPFTDRLPGPVFHRVEAVPANGLYPEAAHDWGEFVYCHAGVTEVTAAGARLLAPPHMGIWIPPGLAHTGSNREATEHCSVYVARDLCAAMPGRLCALVVTPLLRAILEELRAVPWDGSAAQGRLLRVLADQLSACRVADSFVPDSADPQLGALLAVLRADPSDGRPLAELARAHGMSERSLIRRCRRDLGMSLTEWRQRLRVVAAISRLQAGASVEAVALDLGYSTASAFIAMFRGLTGESPGRFVGR